MEILKQKFVMTQISNSVDRINSKLDIAEQKN